MAEPSSSRHVGKYERLAQERQQRDFDLARGPEGHPRGLWFDDAAAERVVSSSRGTASITKGSGPGGRSSSRTGRRTTSSGPSSAGRMRTGRRRYRTAYIEVGRKNGKTELCGGLGLYLMVGDCEPGAEVYASATKKDQAKIVWSVAAAMVKRSRELKRFIDVLKTNLSARSSHLNSSRWARTATRSTGSTRTATSSTSFMRT
jgi:hypothetical protein